MSILLALPVLLPIVLFILDWVFNDTSCQYGINYSRKFIREHIEFAKSGKMVR